MKNSFYFDHDYSARNDQKILKLRAKYGLEGYGFFWCLIESMAEDSTGYIDGSAIDVLSLSYGLAIEKVKEFIDYMVCIQLIEKCEHGNYFNKRILEHKTFRDERIASGKKGALKRWQIQSVNGSANGQPLPEPMHIKDIKDIKGDKVNKIKNIFIPPSFDEFKNYCIENGFEKIADRAYKGYVAGDWHDAQGSKIIRWKQKLINGWFKPENKDQKWGIGNL